MNDFRLLPAALATWLVGALGVGLGGSGLGVLALGVAALLLLAAPVVAGVRRRWGRPATGALATAWVAVAAVAVVAGSCAVQARARDRGLLHPLVTDRATVTVVGVVRAEAVPLRNTSLDGQPRVRTVLAVEQVSGRGLSGEAAAQLLLIGGRGWAEIPYGARVRARGRLSPTEPADELRGILVAAGDPELVDPPGPLDRGVARIRQGLLSVSDELTGDARALVPGTAIGDTSRIPPDLDQAMRDVSLTHVTAVSGAHFAVLSVSVLGLTAALGLSRWARAAVTASVMAGFVVLVHPQPSVVRAAVMGAVSVVGLVLGRPARAVPALSTAVVVLLVLDPWLARSYGFVLSVVATGAIALLAPAIAARLRRFLPNWLAVAVAVPVAAQAACAPVLVLLDPGVSLYAVPANVLVAPALYPATVLGVAGALLPAWFPAGASLLVHAAGVANWWIAVVARTCAALPGARQGWLAGPWGVLALAGLTGLALFALRRGSRRRYLVVGCCALFVFLPALRDPVLRALDPWPPRDWAVVLCDVGQGDTLVVRSGVQAAVVVDVGPDGSAADACLDRLGVTRIDLLVLTHYHADHVGGLGPVLRGRQVEMALVSPLAQPAPEATRTLTALERAGVPVVAGARDGVVPTGVAGEVAWTVLWPRRDAAGWDPEQPNNASVVTVLRARDVTVLALGDVEREAQEGLAAMLGRDPPSWSVDVVNVAHHGSASQSERLAGLLPARLALIGVGENDYGHPAPSTVARYHQAGTVVLDTLACGSIAVTAEGDGRGLRVTAGCVD